jgi:glycosyltransferase involved in cell wall biosynthesis
MTSVEFEASGPAAAAEAGPAVAKFRLVVETARPRLAIVSTYSELCGVAAYARRLEHQLADDFDITVFDLDQYLLRARHARVRKFGDRHIREICRALKDFDAVNLQFEHGTLGYSAGDIYRRFKWIVGAAPRLSVTFHTTVDSPAFDYSRWFKAIVRLRLAEAATISRSYHRAHLLSVGLAKRLRRVQRFRPVTLIVHTRREKAHMTYAHGLRNIYDHPLAFLSESEAARIRTDARRSRFPILDAVPDAAQLIGVFGFISRYKGFETVIQALHHLPDDHHLLIFGGIHPNEIRSHQPIDPVVLSLFEAGYVGTTLAEAGRPEYGAPAVALALDDAMRDLLVRHPKDLSHRIHFLGATNDTDFLAGMALCDAVVFPYLEVGQSSSGPISQALELGCRVIASRTHTFLQLGRYHRDTIEYFDIGNYLELAARIAARPQYDPRTWRLAYTVETNRAIYLAANDAGGRKAVRIKRQDAG